MLHTESVSTMELHLAVLATGPRHGYEVKKEHDQWFPETRPLAYGQVYATLGRLVRDGLAEIVETHRERGPERTVYAVTDAGIDRLKEWLAEPAPPAGAGSEEVVRKTVVALRAAAATGGAVAARDVVARQRAVHLRKMRALQESPHETSDDVATRLVRRHALLHLDADLRWLDDAADAMALEGTPSSEENNHGGS